MQRAKWSGMVEEHPGKGTSDCKCPEAEGNMIHLGNKKEVNVTGAKSGRSVNSTRMQVSRSTQRLDQADPIKTTVKSLSLNMNI